MKHRSLFFPALAALLTALTALTGCRSVPGSNRYQLLLTSSEEENQLGAEAYQQYKQKLKVSGNAAYNQALTRVGTAIKNVAPANDFAWEFLVFEDTTANAFCLPGGKVAVYSGIFPYIANDAELACVVSHEIAHAIARHSGERMSWSALQSAGAQAISSDSEVVQAIYGLGTNIGVMLPFSRTQESEADYLGLKMMAQAGYDPSAALSFWKKFGTDSGSKISDWLSTHPGGSVRVADLEKHMSEAQELYSQAPTKRGLGNTLK